MSTTETLQKLVSCSLSYMISDGHGAAVKHLSEKLVQLVRSDIRDCHITVKTTVKFLAVTGVLIDASGPVLVPFLLT